MKDEKREGTKGGIKNKDECENELPESEALFLFLRYEFNDIVRRASNDLTQFLQSKQIDIPSFPETVERFIADTAL